MVSVAILPVMRAAVVMPRNAATAELQAGAGVMRGTPVHTRPLQSLEADEQSHDQRSEEGTEGPRGTG